MIYCNNKKNNKNTFNKVSNTIKTLKLLEISWSFFWCKVLSQANPFRGKEKDPEFLWSYNHVPPKNGYRNRTLTMQIIPSISNPIQILNPWYLSCIVFKSPPWITLSTVRKLEETPLFQWDPSSLEKLAKISSPLGKKQWNFGQLHWIFEL